MHIHDEDRISNLPDCLLLHILSFLKVEPVVQTCVLSKRWNNIWKHLPTLRFNSRDFKSLKAFTKFVSIIFSLRCSSTALSALHFVRSGIVEPHILQWIVNYAISHNVRLLDIDVRCDIKQFPSCLFSCQSLTTLHLSVCNRICRGERILFPNSVKMPALTTLSLRRFIFSSGDDGRCEPFSAFKKLNSLTIRYCKVVDAQNLCISSLTLVNLTIQNFPYVNDDFRKVELSSPSLSMFAFSGSPCMELCGSNISSIKHINIDARLSENSVDPPSILLSTLLKLADIKSMTVTADTLQTLSLLKMEFPFLCNLKSLTIKMTPFSYATSGIPAINFKEGSSCIREGVVDYLLQNSPLARVYFIE
ncbi:F-box/LRR-repeat protein At3g26922-like [Vicia villosa]|uniref:F-box/LRR-repeat protein At3g26922-like n=1 Tax=Vicia villosa TaxID=3911 RepID=UPI00273A9119|nr:F-box/LRR-repeat protein At3g26922-like [Vicia villosa]